MMCGGFNAEKPATEEIQVMVTSFKEQIEQKLSAVFTEFKAVSYTTQVVAGTNYKVKVQVDGGKTVEVKIYEPLKHTGNPKSLSVANYL